MSSTPSTSRPAASRPAGSESRRTTVIAVVAVVLLIGGTIMFLAVLASGAVTGTEFSPRTFAVRGFTYYEIPIVHWQVTPIKRTPHSAALESHLQSEKLLPRPPANSDDPWHLVSLERSGVTVQQGDADLLVKYLRQSLFAVNPASLDWTKKHPELAKEFWPVVARLARRNEYVLIPDLFEQTHSAKTPAELRTVIAQKLAERYRHWAQVEYDAGHRERAADLLDQAFAYAKDLPGLHGELSKVRQQWSVE